MCPTHYTRWLKYGDPNFVTPRKGVQQGFRIAVPSYATLHARLWLRRGKASEHACVICGQPAQQWALVRRDHVLTQDGLDYSVRLDDYDPLCAPCHGGFDHGGERNYRTRLTNSDVVEMRARYARGEAQILLAQEYGVHANTVGMIVHRKTWRHIDRPEYWGEGEPMDDDPAREED